VPELPDGLSIGELARRTQVPAPTLRSWEDRYGFPRPQRLAGGHRRYDHGDVALVEAVLRLRASGMSLHAAISQAASRPAEAESSVFAGLRRRHPALTPQVLRKVTLLALTRAIEDECCARAERPVLFASFQRQRFFRQSQERWNELARTARVVVVFADFSGRAGAGGPPPGEPAPIRVPLPEDAPARREWILVCESPDYPACVTGWEFPGQREPADADRRFEVVWSVDPQVVSNAAAICAQLARSARPGLGRLLGALPSEPAPPASADLRRATGLLTRMTGYLEEAAAGEVRRGPLPGRDRPHARHAPDPDIIGPNGSRFPHPRRRERFDVIAPAQARGVRRAACAIMIDERCGPRSSSGDGTGPGVHGQVRACGGRVDH
jgi:MerR family transcriptional regulator, light-induced transcriptional regulator